MGTTYRYIESPAETSSVLQWFRGLPTPPIEKKTERATVLYFRTFGELSLTDSGSIDTTRSPVVTLFLPRSVRGALWSVGEVHFLAAPLKELFPELYKINGEFSKWLRQFDVVFSNKPNSTNEWNYYLEGSIRNYDPPVFGFPSGIEAIQNGQYFISDSDTDATIGKVCSLLKLRGIHCDTAA